MKLIKAVNKGWLKIVEKTIKNRQGFKLVMGRNVITKLLQKANVIQMPWPILRSNHEAISKTILAIFKFVDAYYHYQLVKQLSSAKYRFRIVQEEGSDDLVIEAVPTYPE